MLDQRGQILHAFPQWRNLNPQHIQAKIQIAPNPPLFRRGFQIAVRGGKYTNVQILPLVAAESVDALAFDRPKNLGLYGRADIANFVQECRAPVSSGEFPVVRCLRPVNAPRSYPKSSLSMSESGIAANSNTRTGDTGARCFRESVARPTPCLFLSFGPRSTDLRAVATHNNVIVLIHSVLDFRTPTYHTPTELFSSMCRSQPSKHPRLLNVRPRHGSSHRGSSNNASLRCPQNCLDASHAAPKSGLIAKSQSLIEDALH